MATGGGGAWGLGDKSASGAWADDVEADEIANGLPAAVLQPVDEMAFPSLEEASKKSHRRERGAGRKGQVKMDFGTFVAGPAKMAERSDKEIRMALPTAPRPRSEEERAAGMGGAFRDYGGDRRGGFRGDSEYGDRRDRDRMGFDDSGGVSRADEQDDWGSTRKFTPSTGADRGGGGGFGGGFGRDRDRDRMGGFGDGDRDRDRDPSAPSAADEADSWSTSKAFVPSSDRGREPERDRRGFGGGGGGFADAYDSRGNGDWGSRRGGGALMDEPRSTRGYGFRDEYRVPEGGGGMGDSRWERRREAFPPRASDEGSGGGAPASARPRLRLEPRTLPKPDIGPPAAGAAGVPSSAASASSSRPGSAASGTDGGGEGGEAPKPRPPRPNPFGGARPREEVLREKGIDPSVPTLRSSPKPAARQPTDEEVELKKELASLKQKLEAARASAAAQPTGGDAAGGGDDGGEGNESGASQVGGGDMDSGGEVAALAAEMASKEAALTVLTKELDHKLAVSSASASPAAPSSPQPAGAAAASMPPPRPKPSRQDLFGVGRHREEILARKGEAEAVKAPGTPTSEQEQSGAGAASDVSDGPHQTSAAKDAVQEVGAAAAEQTASAADPPAAGGAPATRQAEAAADDGEPSDSPVPNGD